MNSPLSRPRTRRDVLRGLGTAVALPFLGSLRSLARAAAPLRSDEPAPPVRSAFLFVPNGAHMPDWTPSGTGAGFDLPWILEPLAPVRDELLILSGLTHDKGRANGDGPGDHARSASVFLTGCQPRKTQGAGIRVGVSVDQVAAAAVGDATRFPSLELAIDRGGNSGNCDSGYSCAYSNNISWRSPTTPMAKETDPRRVFNRLFASGDRKEVSAAETRRRARRSSVLDFVREDARRLERRLDASDRRKLDEYLGSVREVEKRVDAVGSDVVASAEEPDGLPVGPGKRLAYDPHLRLMLDLLVLAFRTDSTRIATLMFAAAGSNRSYRTIGVSEGHHQLSHHQNRRENHEKIRRINRHHVEQLAYFLERLRAVPEGDGTLLDHSMIVYGSGISDGNRHNNENLPVVVAGRGGGTLDTGRHVSYPHETPLCNLFVSLLDRQGASVERFGDSTGDLRYLSL